MQLLVFKSIYSEFYMNMCVRQIRLTSFPDLLHISNSHHIYKDSFTVEYELHEAKFI